MATPEGLPTVTLIGQYLEPDILGTPMQGSLVFTPSVSLVTFPDQNVLITGALTVNLDTTGAFSITMIATDTANANPSGWSYTVTEKIVGVKNRVYNIFLPYTTETINLADITPTDAAPVYLPVVGPTGPPGVIQEINGYSATSVTLDAADVEAVSLASMGVASGVATLDINTLIPVAQIPNLSATYVTLVEKGVANGVSSLNSSGVIPISQIPDISATYVTVAEVGAPSGVVPLTSGSKISGTYLSLSAATALAIATAGATGTSSNLSREDHVHPGLTQSTADGRYPIKAHLALNGADYGLVGDGITDNATFLANLLAAVPLTGTQISIPPGVYYVNSGTGLNISEPGTTLLGSGRENTKFVIGPAFAGAQLFNITGHSSAIRDISISGWSSTTVNNPVCNAIEITGTRRTQLNHINFWNINGWAIEAMATSLSSTSNPLGTQIFEVAGNNCAGGIHFQGNSVSSWAMNSQITDVQFYGGGVTTGTSANLDGIRITDSWDVLVNHPIIWMTHGGGSCIHIVGTSAATFITKADLLGPSSGTGPCVLIEDSTNGSPQNTQIDGGVIQQGSPGLLITGGATQVHIRSRLINNITHGITVAGTGNTIHFFNCFYSGNGAGGSGTNYDINWSGTATGRVTNNTLSTALTTSGTPGVQYSVNVATAGQAITFENLILRGTGTATTNRMTNVPAGWLDTSNGGYTFNTGVAIQLGSGTSLSITGGTAGQRLFGTTALATDTTAIAHGAGVSGETYDRLRILVDGTIQMGAGTTNRDTFSGRAGVGILYTSHTMLVGSTTALGDNGLGTIQLADASTKPNTPPTAGTTIYSQSGSAIPLMAYFPGNSKQSLINAWATATADQTSSGTAQTSSTYLTLAVESSATYEVEAWAYWTTASSSTVSTSWATTATGSTMVWNDTTTGGDVVTILTGVSPAWATGAKMVFLKGLLKTSATAGNITFTWASSVSTSATLKAGSYLTLKRIN